MSFEEYLRYAANGDESMVLNHVFREEQAPNWLRHLKELNAAESAE